MLVKIILLCFAIAYIVMDIIRFGKKIIYNKYSIDCEGKIIAIETHYSTKPGMARCGLLLSYRYLYEYVDSTFRRYTGILYSTRQSMEYKVGDYIKIKYCKFYPSFSMTQIKDIGFPFSILSIILIIIIIFL